MKFSFSPLTFPSWCVVLEMEKSAFYVLSPSRMPQLFTKDIALVQQFFESMCKVGDRSLKSLTLNSMRTQQHTTIYYKKPVCQNLLYNPFLSLYSTEILIAPKFFILFLRRSPMYVLPSRKPCLWWSELMPTYRGHCWTWWRPWWVHTLERWVCVGKIDMFHKETNINVDNFSS